MNIFDTTSGRPPARTISVFNIVLGVWMMVSPFFMHFIGNSRVTWNNFLTGVLITFFAIERLFDPQRRRGWSWANCALAIWLIISPFVLGFGDFPRAMWNSIIIGIFVLIVAWSSAGAGSRAMA